MDNENIDTPEPTYQPETPEPSTYDEQPVQTPEPISQPEIQAVDPVQIQEVAQPDVVVNATQPETFTEPQPMPVQPVVAVEDPAKTISVVGLVLALLVPPAGLVVSIIAFSKAKKIKSKTTMSLIGIIFGAISTVAIIAAIIIAVSMTSTIIQTYDYLY